MGDVIINSGRKTFVVLWAGCSVFVLSAWLLSGESPAGGFMQVLAAVGVGAVLAFLLFLAWAVIVPIYAWAWGIKQQTGSWFVGFSAVLGALALVGGAMVYLQSSDGAAHVLWGAFMTVGAFLLPLGAWDAWKARQYRNKLRDYKPDNLPTKR